MRDPSGEKSGSALSTFAGDRTRVPVPSALTIVIRPGPGGWLRPGGRTEKYTMRDPSGENVGAIAALRVFVTVRAWPVATSPMRISSENGSWVPRVNASVVAPTGDHVPSKLAASFVANTVRAA